MGWNTITNGFILTWIAICVLISINIMPVAEYATLASIAGWLTGAGIFTGLGSLMIYYIGKEIIKRMKKNKITN
jgi:hypothetical protein